MGRYNAREHPLFEYFQQHLPGHPCWSVLERVEQSYRQYLAAWRQAYTEVLHRAKKELADLSQPEGYADPIASSLMTYAFHDGNFEFRYELHKSDYKGLVSWDLNLGAWNVGYKEDPEELKPFIEMHQRLVEEVLSWEVVQTFSQRHADAREKTAEFRQCLQPYLRLEPVLRRSGCDWCR